MTPTLPELTRQTRRAANIETRPPFKPPMYWALFTIILPVEATTVHWFVRWPAGTPVGKVVSPECIGEIRAYLWAVHSYTGLADQCTTPWLSWKQIIHPKVKWAFAPFPESKMELNKSLINVGQRGVKARWMAPTKVGWYWDLLLHGFVGNGGLQCPWRCSLYECTAMIGIGNRWSLKGALPRKTAWRFNTISRCSLCKQLPSNISTCLVRCPYM